MVSPNHPFRMFHERNNRCWGSPIYGNTHIIYIYMYMINSILKIVLHHIYIINSIL